MAGITVACPCGEVYEIRPEFAGRLLECPACGHHLRAGRAPAAERAPAPGVDAAFDRDVFLLRQRALSIASKYEVWSEQGRPVAYVERPTYPVRTALAYLLAGLVAIVVLVWTARAVEVTGPGAGGALALAGYTLAAAVAYVVSLSARPRRHVTIYRDESRAEPLLRILQDQRLAVLARTYTLTQPDGTVLARLRKSYVHNLVRKRWDVTTPEGRPLVTAMEDSVVLSLLRRVLGPLFGVLRTNFVLLRADGETLGEFNRKLTLLDRYALDLTADPEIALDRRIALALGIMLDTGERR